MKRLLTALALCLLSLLPLSGCGSASTGETLLLYFPSAASVGSALGSEEIDLSQSLSPEEDLIHALLAGPTSEELLSPFPRGVTLRSWHLRDGVLHISLSEQYGGLSGISLTLADCSIALTLCQLDGIDGVSITVENDPIPYRYRQTLTPQDILLPESGA